MKQRWWAPDSAHVGPDQLDLALLENSGSPVFDLGAALLAYHRVGAAACEHVAKGLPNEAVLVDSLARAREQFAIPMVGSVSKSVGEGPYAGLLVRDVADDAERAALDLFRAAVAKGVAPSLAVQRVGLAYGIPTDQLGSYRALATTPAANPVALQNAADKALMEWVEGVCKEEADTSELVSKEQVQRQRVAQPDVGIKPDNPQTTYYDGRDASGQFASRASLAERVQDRRGPQVGDDVKSVRTLRDRLAARKAPKVEEQIAAPVARRKSISGKKGKRGLKARTVEEQKTIERTRSVSRTRTVNPRSAKRTRTNDRFRTLEARAEKASLKNAPVQPELKDPLDFHPVEFPQVNTTLAYTLAQHEIADLKRTAVYEGADAVVFGRDLFNAGHHADEVASTEDESKTDRYVQDAKDGHEDTPFTRINPDEPTFVTISKSADNRSIEDAKRLAALDYISIKTRGWDRMSEEEQQELLDDEIQNVQEFNHARDPERLILLHLPMEYAMPPVVSKLHVSNPRAMKEDTLKNPHFMVDPDQKFKVNFNDPVRYYDPPPPGENVGVVINFYDAEPIDDVDKAFQESEVVRDTRGRFAPENKGYLEAPQEQSTKPSLEERLAMRRAEEQAQGPQEQTLQRRRSIKGRSGKRGIRGKIIPVEQVQRDRQLQRERSMGERTRVRGLSRERQAALARATVAVNQAPSQQLPGAPDLDPGQQYRTFSVEDFFDQFGGSVNNAKGVPESLGDAKMLEGMLDGYKADKSLHQSIVDQVENFEEEFEEEVLFPDERILVDANDPQATKNFLSRLRVYMMNNPDVAMISVHEIPIEMGAYGHEVEVIAYKGRVEPQVLVEIDSEVTPEHRNLEMTYLGTYNKLELNRSGMDRAPGRGEDGWKITNGQVESYYVNARPWR